MLESVVAIWRRDFLRLSLTKRGAMRRMPKSAPRWVRASFTSLSVGDRNASDSEREGARRVNLGGPDLDYPPHSTPSSCPQWWIRTQYSSFRIPTHKGQAPCWNPAQLPQPLAGWNLRSGSTGFCVLGERLKTPVHLRAGIQV